VGKYPLDNDIQFVKLLPGNKVQRPIKFHDRAHDRKDRPQTFVQFGIRNNVWGE